MNLTEAMEKFSIPLEESQLGPTLSKQGGSKLINALIAFNTTDEQKADKEAYLQLAKDRALADGLPELTGSLAVKALWFREEVLKEFNRKLKIEQHYDEPTLTPEEGEELEVWLRSQTDSLFWANAKTSIGSISGIVEYLKFRWTEGN